MSFESAMVFESLKFYSVCTVCSSAITDKDQSLDWNLNLNGT